MSSCILGGTFNIMHAGHIALLQAAKPYAQVYIGLTTDQWARAHHHCAIAPAAKRRAALRRELEHLGMSERTLIFPLSNRFGSATNERSLDAIVVSSETNEVAGEINKIRHARHLHPLKIIVVPLQMAQDGLPFSASRISGGKIDVHGHRLQPLRVAVGSENPSKLEGVRHAMRRAFPNMRLELRGFRVKSGVGEQPLGHSTIELGAHNRAKAACNVWPACDYSIGLESGLLPFGGRYFDLQFACISDGSADTFGCSMGFPLPKNIAGKMIKTNKTKNKFSRFRVTCSLGSVIDKLSGEKNVGRGKGAISFLSRGLLERKEMTEQAVLCALVERRSPV